MPDAQHPGKDEMAVALNQALADGDTYQFMGALGRIARAHRMRVGKDSPANRPWREEPLQVHEGRSQARGGHRDPRAGRPGLQVAGNSYLQQSGTLTFNLVGQADSQQGGKGPIPSDLTTEQRAEVA